MRKIYICSALCGNTADNIRKAKCCCEYVVKEHDVIPIAPHIYFTQFLDDENIEERKFGMQAGLFLLSECNELWYFGDHMSEGMTKEICIAMEHGIPVRYIPRENYQKYMEERNFDYVLS